VMSLLEKGVAGARAESVSPLGSLTDCEKEELWSAFRKG